MTDGTAKSVHARLLAHARELGEDFNLILSRYSIERFLYRLSISSAREDFCLKGAQLFYLWFDEPHRPTRDADLLGMGAGDAGTVTVVMANVAKVDADDGMVFDPDSVTAEVIREGTRYGGLRVKVLGQLGNARCPIQLDVGFGDAVEPAPNEEEFPTLLSDQPAPRLLAYPRAAVMAEKLEAIVHLGMANSRMKDYYDLLTLVRKGEVDASTLARAIAATFARRGTTIPASPPLGLSDAFSGDAEKRMQWRGFLGRNKLDAPDLEAVVMEINEHVAEPFRVALELG